MCGARQADESLSALLVPGRSTSYARGRLAEEAQAALAPLGITVRVWAGRFVLSTRTGRSAIVERYADVAAAVEALR